MVETAHPAETFILGPLYLSPSISSGAQERGLLLTRKESYTAGGMALGSKRPPLVLPGHGEE